MLIFILKLIIHCLLVSLVCTEEIKDDSNFTFTFDMTLSCKEHLCLKGYYYDTFYEVDSKDRRVYNNSDVLFEMHIAILAASNGHILLSTIPHPEPSDPVYEIVIGGGANKFTELRRNLRRNSKSSVKTLDILSAIEFRAFYIRIMEDGTIELGKEGSKTPLISFFDVNPVPVKYFSFACWSGVEAKFLYDCPVPGENGKIGTRPESKMVEPKLSPSQKLKKMILKKLSPHMPGVTIPIKLEVEVTSVTYNALDAKMTTSLSVYTSWADDNMAWDPNEHNGTTRLTFSQGQIWKPTFFVYNSGDIGAVDTRNVEPIWVFHSGEAILHFDTRLQTWCADYTSGLTKWPRDEYTCFVVIGLWEAHEKIKIEEVRSDPDPNSTFPDVEEVIETEWEMIVKQGVVHHPDWNKLFKLFDNDTHQSDRFLVKVNLKRRATTYDIVFYTPLLVLITFLLMSLWTEPIQMTRVWFYGGMATTICMGLCYIDYLIPCHSVPFILVIYLVLLVAVFIALLIQILLMQPKARSLSKTETVQHVLTSKIFRTLLFMTPIKTCSNYESINEAYNAQEDDDSGVVFPPRVNAIEEMQTEDTRRSEIEEVAEVLDKLLFFVYFVVFVVLLCL